MIDLSVSPRVFFSIFHPGGKDRKDEFEELIDTVLVLYGDYSIYEVMDLDRPAAIARMVEMYGGQAYLERIERFFAVLDRIRAWREPTPLYLEHMERSLSCP